MSYTKNTWSTGDVITKELLNNMEDGIKEAHDTFEEQGALQDGMFSDVFDTATSYAAGDYCIYENVLYKFTKAKSAGAWDSTAVEATTLVRELMKVFESFLPLATGGRLTGNLEIKGDDESQKQVVVTNSLAKIGLIVNGNGNQGLYCAQHGKWIIYMTAEGVTGITGLKTLTLNNLGSVFVGDDTPDWLTLTSGVNGVNVKDHTNRGTWRPLTASALHQTSSRLIKENINDISEEEALKILDTRPVSFDFKKEVGGQKSRVGLIAEELLDLYPHSVTVPEGYKEEEFDITKDIPLTVDYVSLLPYLIKMVQIQQKKIDELENGLVKAGDS